jgi:predicted unusual protein kinase regulating ubiquinone biosynthesis (AarF/ABC1/UbiB family)
VPNYYKELSGRRVITMEYVEGKKINDRKAIEQDLKLNSKDCARILLESFALMIFKYGHIHCDAHPGNLLVR